MSNTRYHPLAKTLHWFMAIGLFITLGVGIWMSDLPDSPFQMRWFAYHKWMGISLLILLVLRGIVRLWKRPPALPEGVSGLTRLAAKVAHGGLYLLMLIVPLVGWALSSANGIAVVFLGWVRLPDFVSKNQALAEKLEDLHGLLAFTLLGFIAVHVLAALYHHFIVKDGLLRRMLPGK